jgi:hypothetical protein
MNRKPKMCIFLARTTEKIFDDFAVTGSSEDFNRQVLGLASTVDSEERAKMVVSE